MKKRQVFLFPFAGGNCYSYRFMLPHLKTWDVVTVELPGRGKRVNEDLIFNFDQAAEDLFRQVAPYAAESGFILYGHSLGALLALKVAGMLEDINKMPGGLVLSGSAGPMAMEKKRYCLPQDLLVSELREMGGMPRNILEHMELFSYLVPIIRADFQILEGKELPPFEKVRAPLEVIMGDQEPQVFQISNWKNFTTAGYTATVCPGGHFFIYQEVLTITTALERLFNYSVVPS